MPANHGSARCSRAGATAGGRTGMRGGENLVDRARLLEPLADPRPPVYTPPRRLSVTKKTLWAVFPVMLIFMVGYYLGARKPTTVCAQGNVLTYSIPKSWGTVKHAN